MLLKKDMSDRKFHDQRGFTLLEIVIALAILSIALVAVLKNGGSNLSLIYESNTLTTASFLCRQKLAEIESDLGETNVMEGDFGKEFPGFRWKAEFFIPPAMLSNARRLEVKILWTEGRRERHFALSQYVSSF